MNKKFPRQYLSADFDSTDPKQVTHAYDELAGRASQLTTVDALKKWIADWEELGGAVHDRYSRAHVASTVDTADKKAEEKYLHIVEHILPLTETRGFELNRVLLQNRNSEKLGAFYDCFLRTARKDVEIFREENVPLKVEEHKLVNEFEKIMGSLTPVFRGQEMTMQQVGRYLEDPDEATRKEAFEARAKARQDVAASLDTLYADMLKLRDRIARNAGFVNFRDYQFAAYHRFDYTPDDCVAFHDAIADLIVPLVDLQHQKKIARLGARTLKPWDLTINAEAKTLVQPFSTARELVDGCSRIFHKIDNELGAYFDLMAKQGLLDLESRKGKAPGGYCTHFDEDRVPFIFMNAAGTSRDVDTLLHEGGHSFHYFLAREIPLTSYHHTGLEFAEVASMSMELLSRPFLAEFYSPDEERGVKDEQLRKILEFFPFMAMIDAFQHWVYVSRTFSPDAWRAKWAELEARFRPDIDWAGFEDLRGIGWQYPHVFSVPFYYVEYGIAQLGALAVWRKSLTDFKSAVSAYKRGLGLGGSRTLPELFRSVDAEFGMSTSIIRPLVATLQEQL